MTAAPVMSITDELVAELELAAFKATEGNWCTDGASWVCASDSDQLNNGFVLAICEGPDANSNAEYAAKASPMVVRALLAERAELVKDRERLDWLIVDGAVVVELKGIQRYHLAWPETGENQVNCFMSPREAIDAARADNP